MVFLARWADAIERVARPVSRGCMLVSMVGVFLMVFLLVAHVIGRFAFKAPILGITELEEFLLLIVTYFGIAYTAILKGHVRVELLVSKFPSWLGHVIDTCTGLAGLTVWSFIIWRSFQWAIEIWDPMVVTQFLRWPKTPFAMLIVFGSAILCFVILAEILRSLHGAITEGGKKALWILAGLALIGVLCLIGMQGNLPFGKFAVGVMGIGVLMLLLLLRMPIAYAMGFMGLVGLWYFRGWEASASNMATTPYYTAAWYLLVVIPLFILMGSFCFHAGISRDLYDTAYAWLGRLPGGIASATIGGCAGFAAICGDSLATAATMGTVALPELKRFKYDDSLSTGALAAGGTLGILIPPSMGFIFYAIITEQSIGKLFIAGIIPGIILASLFILTITIRAKINPKLGPPGPATSWVEKFKALRKTFATLILFLVVIGGIYTGIFTPIEAGAIGAFGAFVIMAINRKLTRQTLSESLLETGRTTAMIMAILVGVFILGFFVGTSEVPLEMAGFIASLEVNRYIILAIVMGIYVLLGCMMNIVPMILLTLPVFYPTIVTLDFDLIWFGVMMVVIIEMGQITPPIGMNVFVIAGVAKDVPLTTIFRGIFPFVVVEMFFMVLLTIFPSLALWLPSMM